MALSVSEAGRLTEPEQKAMELMESNIDKYLNDHFDPITRGPVEINAGFIYHQVDRANVTTRVVNRLVALYTTDHCGWQVEGTDPGSKTWTFSPKRKAKP